MTTHFLNIKENPITGIKFTEGEDLNYVYRAATEATYKPYLFFWKQQDDPPYKEGWGSIDCYWERYSEKSMEYYDNKYIHTDSAGNKSVRSKDIILIQFKDGDTLEFRFTDFDEAWSLLDHIKSSIEEGENTIEFEV